MLLQQRRMPCHIVLPIRKAQGLSDNIYAGPFVQLLVHSFQYMAIFSLACLLALIIAFSYLACDMFSRLQARTPPPTTTNTIHHTHSQQTNQQRNRLKELCTIFVFRLQNWLFHSLCILLFTLPFDILWQPNMGHSQFSGVYTFLCVWTVGSLALLHTLTISLCFMVVTRLSQRNKTNT